MTDKVVDRLKGAILRFGEFPAYEPHFRAARDALFDVAGEAVTEIQRASDALAALGVSDDGRPLAERIEELGLRVADREDLATNVIPTMERELAEAHRNAAAAREKGREEERERAKGEAFRKRAERAGPLPVSLLACTDPSVLRPTWQPSDVTLPDGLSDAARDAMRTILACVHAEGLPRPHINAWSDKCGFGACCHWEDIDGTVTFNDGEDNYVEWSCDDGQRDPERGPVHGCSDVASTAVLVRAFVAAVRRAEEGFAASLRNMGPPADVRINRPSPQFETEPREPLIVEVPTLLSRIAEQMTGASRSCSALPEEDPADKAAREIGEMSDEEFAANVARFKRTPDAAG